MAEGKRSFVLYKNWGDFVTGMTDEEAGQLLKAIYALEVTGEEAEPEDRVAALIYAGIRDKLLEDIDKYEETCARRSESSARGVEARKRRQPSGLQKQPSGSHEQPSGSARQPSGNQLVGDTDTDTEKENDIDTEGNPPIAPRSINAVPRASAEDLASVGVPPALTEQVSQWIANKDARRETLTENEFKSFVSTVNANAARYGVKAVSDLIKDTMSNGYKGIPWDRLERRARDKPTNTFLQDLMEVEA